MRCGAIRCSGSESGCVGEVISFLVVRLAGCGEGGVVLGIGRWWMEGGSEWRFYSRVTRAGRKQMALAQGGGRKLYGIERVGGDSWVYVCK